LPVVHSVYSKTPSPLYPVSVDVHPSKAQQDSNGLKASPSKASPSKASPSNRGVVSALTTQTAVRTLSTLKPSTPGATRASVSHRPMAPTVSTPLKAIAGEGETNEAFSYSIRELGPLVLMTLVLYR
jgi:hypothetical protein